jgi:membrane protein implicated in regulation of membrane protease activity
MALLIGGTLAYLFLPFPWFLAVVGVLAAVEVFEFRLWRWALRQGPRSGIESMVGERGILAPEGRVRIRGSSYPARSRGASAGDAVVVEDVDGMTLVVRPATEEDMPR